MRNTGHVAGEHQDFEQNEAGKPDNSRLPAMKKDHHQARLSCGA
jgi:hypothetical protein